jgi:hypothetical protein
MYHHEEGIFYRSGNAQKVYPQHLNRIAAEYPFYMAVPDSLRFLSAKINEFAGTIRMQVCRWR